MIEIATRQFEAVSAFLTAEAILGRITVPISDDMCARMTASIEKGRADLLDALNADVIEESSSTNEASLIAVLEVVLPEFINARDTPAKPWRAGGGYYFHVDHERETFISDRMFDDCGANEERVRQVVRRHLAAIREGSCRPNGLKYTETCHECGEHVYGPSRSWRDTGCVTHADEWEHVLLSQGSLSASESECLAEVRAFLKTGQPWRS